MEEDVRGMSRCVLLAPREEDEDMLVRGRRRIVELMQRSVVKVDDADKDGEQIFYEELTYGRVPYPTLPNVPSRTILLTFQFQLLNYVRF